MTWCCVHVRLWCYLLVNILRVKISTYNFILWNALPKERFCPYAPCNFPHLLLTDPRIFIKYYYIQDACLFSSITDCLYLIFLCRNFPQGTISDMVKDVSQGISFVCNIIGEYGGDPNRWLIDSFICARLSHFHIMSIDSFMIIFE